MIPSAAAQRFALALPGVWLTMHKRSFAHFGGRPAGPEARRWARGLLKDSWGVTDAAGLHERLKWLGEEGHTAEYFATREEYRAAPPDRRGDTLQLLFVGRFGDAVGETGLVAWDQARLINVAGWGFLAGYHTEEEAWSYILPAAQRCQRAYGSWEAFGRAYLLGVAFWGPAHLEKNQPALDALLADTSGPWSSIPWSTPLGGSASDDEGGGIGGTLVKVAGMLVAAGILLALCAGVGVVGVGGAMFVATRAPGVPSIARSDWDGAAPFVCKGNEKRTISGITARIADGVAVSAEGNCQLTIVDADIAAPTALKAGINAKVTIQGGRLAGTTHAIEALNNANVTMTGTVVEGPVSKKNNAKISGP